MAADRSASRFQRAPFLSEIDKEIGSILAESDNQNKCEVVNKLLDIPDETVKGTRADIFEFAKTRLDSGALEGESNGLETLTLKERRTKKAICEDLLDLYVFAAGLRNVFPKEMIHRSSKSGLLTSLGSKVTTGKEKQLLNTENLDLPGLLQQVAQLTSEVNEMQIQTERMKIHYENKLEELKRDYTDRITNIQDILAKSIQENIIQPEAQSTQNAMTDDVVKTVVNGNTVDIKVVDTVIDDFVDDMDDSLFPCAQPPPRQQQSHRESSSSEGEDTQKDKSLFSNVLMHEGPWQMVEKKTQRRKTANLERARAAKSASPPPLKEKAPQHIPDSPNFKLMGAPKVLTQELYLQNVYIDRKMPNKEIAEGVIRYGAKRGIQITACWVKRNRFTRYQVGCKLTVPRSEIEKCKDVNSWPEHITCRDWEKKPAKSQYGQSGGRRPNDWRGDLNQGDLRAYDVRSPAECRREDCCDNARRREEYFSRAYELAAHSGQDYNMEDNWRSG